MNKNMSIVLGSVLCLTCGTTVRSQRTGMEKTAIIVRNDSEGPRVMAGGWA